MDEDFQDFISRRCEKALLECEDYISKEQSNFPEDELRIMAEELCYKKGFLDALAIVKCSPNL